MSKIECPLEKDPLLNDFTVVLKEEKAVAINLVCLSHANVRTLSKHVHLTRARAGVRGKGVFLKRFVDSFLRIFIKSITPVAFCVL